MKAFVFVLLSMLSGVMVVSSYHAVQSVLWLVLAFLGAAGLFLLYDFGFIALILIIVYVGAIATLFLFVVMMLDLSSGSGSGIGDRAAHYLPAAFLVSVVFISGLFGFKGRFDGPLRPRLSNLEVFGELLYTEFFYLFLLASFVLLAAMVGVIILVGEFVPTNKAQGLFYQVSRFIK